MPGEVISCDYGLEYGRNILEIQKGLVKPGQKAVIVDDVLATGGTLEAITKLLTEQGVIISRIIVLMELDGFNSHERLPYDIKSLIYINKGE